MAEKGPKRAFKRHNSTHSFRKAYVFSILACFVVTMPQTPRGAPRQPKRDLRDPRGPNLDGRRGCYVGSGDTKGLEGLVCTYK
eukprot:8809222-Pyramimonas_sp.AAC.1